MDSRFRLNPLALEWAHSVCEMWFAARVRSFGVGTAGDYVSVYYFPPWGHAVPTNDKRQFTSYNDFFVFYLGEHSKRGTRYMHLCGTVLGLAVLIWAIVTAHYWWILLWPLIGYTFAWIGHFGIEGNRPATFGHPFWSFISDFKMVYLMLTGQLSSYVDASEAASKK